MTNKVENDSENTMDQELENEVNDIDFVIESDDNFLKNFNKIKSEQSDLNNEIEEKEEFNDENIEDTEEQNKTDVSESENKEEKVEKESLEDKPGNKTISSETEESDFKSLYEAEKEKLSRILGPLKANGKTINIDSVDDVVKLMQKGANYTRKTQALAAYKKTITLLEDNNLLEDNKLNNLIDIVSGNKEAIIELLKTNNIDPLDLTQEILDDNKYTPTEYSKRISQEDITKDLQLEEYLNEFTSDNTGKEIVNIVYNEWDKESQKIALNNPEWFDTIKQHKNAGIYDIITSEIEKRKVVEGKYAKNFLQAYHSIGTELEKQGRFNNIVGTNPSNTTTRHVVDEKPKTSIKKNTDKLSKETINTIAPSKNTQTSKTKEKLDHLNMNDEEFLANFDMIKRLKL
jgi:hypothetical protein